VKKALTSIIQTISGTTMKVIKLVLNHLAYGWSPQELKFQHPYLSMKQIHSALAYYWDHKDEIDDQIERDAEEVDRLIKEAEVPPFVKNLRQRLGG
jgi:uncharacterized protein (DUF433 family)